MVANRDLMALALEPVYGSATTNLADWEGMHWVAEGFEPAGPGDKASWYAAQGASGTYYGDLEADYWANVYAGGGGGGTPPTNTVTPLVSGSTAALGNVVTVGDGTWTGDATIVFTYQWQVSDTGVGGWTDISGETANSITIEAAEQGKYIRCVVTGTNGAGSASANSDVCAVESAGLTLLKSSTLWLDASDMASGAQWLRNKGTGGRALDARVGSVGSAQIINGALKLPGVLNNNATAPGSAVIYTPASGDFDIIFRAQRNWASSTQMAIVSNFSSGSTGFEVRVSTSNKMDFIIVGTAIELASVATWGTDEVWCRVTYEADTGGGNYRARLFKEAGGTATVPSSWTQVGIDVTGTSLAYQASTNAMTIGQRAITASSPFLGTVHRVIVKDGIDGAAIFDADFTAQSTLATSFTESSSNAATVTINSTSGVDTNDPLLLPHTGTNYLYLPGTASNNATSPDSAALDITGDIDIQAEVAMLDWTPAASNNFISKVSSTTANLSYGLAVGIGGAVQLYWSADGVSILSASSTANPTVADGDRLWTRATMDVNDGAGNRVVKFYTSTDGSSWTQLGTTVTTAGATSIQASTGTLNIGSYGTAAADRLAGNVYRVRILNGYDGAGSVVFDANFTANTDQSSFTESSSNAATVTINRATSGRKSVMVVRPTLLFGTDDYLEVADNDLLDFNAEDFTAFAVMRAHSYPGGANARVISKRTAAAGNYGWEVLFGASSTAMDFYGLYDTSSGDSGTGAGDHTITSGQRLIAGMVVDDSAGTLQTFMDSTLATARTLPVDRDTRTTQAFQVGRIATPGGYFAGEIEHVAVFRSALTSTELGQIMSYLGVS